jgi:hypothetical protein
MMNEAETRAALANVHAPKLDELRAAIPKMRTSELLGLIVHAEGLVDMLDDGATDIHAAAALWAIANEIDRRIPVP